MARHFVVIALFATSTLAQANTAGPIVDLGYAKYLGKHNSSLDINEFLGIPFAAPPVGPLRWKAPQPYVPSADISNTTVDATVSGNSCVQGYPEWTLSGPVPTSGSEDCLVLNVITPGNTTATSKLPVLFSIHGGGYTLGDASIVAPYALMQHAKNAFIFVNIQYRLGAYGFIGSDKYEKEGGAANAGLLDQRFALEWAQENIAAFGGDPARVTILGGSAGGGSVTSMMTWRGGEKKAPFSAAVADFPWWQQYLRDEQLETQYRYLLTATNCADLDCLQKVSEEALKTATQATYTMAYKNESYGYGSFYYGPYVDGDFLQDLPSREFKAGHFTKVPTWVSREGFEGVTFSNFSMTTIEEETADLKTHFPYANQTFIDEVYKLYPSESFNSTFFQRQTWFGDFSINCPTHYIGDSLAASGTAVFKEVFNSGTKLHGSTGPFLADLDYASTPGANVTLADAMKDWYVSFAIHHDPNAQSWSKQAKPTWPDYKTGEVMSLNDTQMGAVDDIYFDNTARCRFFWQNEDLVQN